VIRVHGLRVGAYEVRVAALPAVAVLLMLALLVSAGLWQLRRAEAKRAIIVEQAYRSEKQPLSLEPDLLDPASLERLRHRQASATGHYREDKQYLLDNRTHKHAAGYHVLTPFQLQGNDVHVLVNRGWLPVGPDRQRLPDVSVSEQSLTLHGVIVAPPGPGLDLGPSGYDDRAWPRVVQRVDLSRIQQQLGSPLLPFVVRLSPDSDYGYERDWRLNTGLTPERHVGYAVQWFALAVALLALSLWAAVKRAPEAQYER
jgi:surfeit locus 1 family protein